MDLLPESRTVSSSRSFRTAPRRFASGSLPSTPPRAALYLLMAACFVAIATIRLSAPAILQHRISKCFKGVQGYEATFKDAQLDVLRRGFILKGVVLRPTTPLMPRIEIAELRFIGGLTSKSAPALIAISGADLTIPREWVVRESDAVKALGDLWSQLWPFGWSVVQVINSNVRVEGAGPRDVFVFENVECRIQNVPRTVDALARLGPEGRIAVHAVSVGPKADALTLNVDVSQVSLSLYSRAIREALGLRVTRGTFGMVMRGNYDAGVFKGYARPEVRGAPGLDPRVSSHERVKRTFGQSLAHVFGSLFHKQNAQNSTRVRSRGLRQGAPVPLLFKNPYAGSWRAVPLFVSKAVSQSLRATFVTGRLAANPHAERLNS